MPERMFGPRRGRRAVSCETSRPKDDSAITTEAGPQLFSDCQTWFISAITAEDGAAFGSGPGAASGAASTRGAACGAATEATLLFSAVGVISASARSGQARPAASAPPPHA